MSRSTVCVIGLGYIGLPTALLIAESGAKVLGYTPDVVARDMLRASRPPFVEAGLREALERNTKSGNFSVVDEYSRADVYLICVPTPLDTTAGNVNSPDLSAVHDVVDHLAKVVTPGDLIILESTSPIGTTESVRERLLDQGTDVDSLYFAYCPERAIPGRSFIEIVANDRVVGGINEASTQVAANFYRTWVTGVVLETLSKNAEASKLVENAFRDVNIAFANELSMLSSEVGVDVDDVIRLANHHPRVDILQPGCGVGGHCIAVDPWFLISQHESSTPLLQAARHVNMAKEHWVLAEIEATVDRFVAETGASPTVCICGIAYKPDVDDLRESPALRIALEATRRWDVKTTDPFYSIFEGLAVAEWDAIEKDTDIFVFLVAHSEFMERKLPTGVQVLDFCNISNN